MLIIDDVKRISNKSLLIDAVEKTLMSDGDVFLGLYRDNGRYLGSVLVADDDEESSEWVAELARVRYGGQTYYEAHWCPDALVDCVVMEHFAHDEPVQCFGEIFYGKDL